MTPKILDVCCTEAAATYIKSSTHMLNLVKSTMSFKWPQR